MGKRIVSILLTMCLCLTVLTGCSSDAPTPAAADATPVAPASDEAPTDGHEKILGFIGDR